MESSVSPANLEPLLTSISKKAPCGDDLSYDNRYLELERLAQGTPEQQVGKTFIPAAEPDWKQVRDCCLDLFEKTKDLRIALYFTLALLKIEGVGGFRDGLALIREWLARYWDTLHPVLDPSDPNPALERVNVVSSLSPAGESYQDPMRFKQRLLETPLTQSGRLGRFGLRDILIAEGKIKTLQAGEGKPPAERSVIEAAFSDTSLEGLEASRQALAEAAEHLEAIHSLFADQIGAGQAPNLDGTTAVLNQMLQQVEKALKRRGAGTTAPAEGVKKTANPDPPPAGGNPNSSSVPGQIKSQQDVVRSLELICQYYERTEPSSPIPMLLRRAQRLVGKTFVDIVRDLTPEAVQQIITLSGMEDTPSPEGGTQSGEEENPSAE